jgi:hypothetical protein
VSVWQAMKDGFLEKTSTTGELVASDTLDGTIGTPGTTGDPGDLSDYASLDMVRASERDDLGLERTDLESEPLRLLNGALDFLGEVAEEGLDFLIDTQQGDGQARPVGKPVPPTVQAATVGCEDWKATTITVATGTTEQIVRRNPARRSVRIINYGPNPVYVGNTSINATMTNRMTIPISKNDGTGPYTPVVLETTNEVWAAGTGGIVEVVEFFGIPDNY